MTIQIIEQLDSRKFTNSGGITGSRTFFAYDDSDNQPSPVDILDDAAMPAIGQNHPDVPNLVADTYTMTPSPERPGAWEVQWQYIPASQFIPDSGPLEIPDEAAAFIPIDITAGVTLVDGWRGRPDVSVGPVNDPSYGLSINDIGGGEIHAKGEAVTIPVVTWEIKITETIVTGSLTIEGLLHRAGKRNASPWLGAGAGYVLYVGSNITRTAAGVYQVDHTFAWDKWKHKRQQPARRPDGTPDWNATDGLEVYWVQPFPDTVDFGFLPEV